MPVLGIFMSRSDAPDANISANPVDFDAEVGDFAWWLPSVGLQGPSYMFGHDEAAGNVTWYHFGHKSGPQAATDDGWLHRIFDVSGQKIFELDLQDGDIRLMVIGSTTSYSGLIPLPTTLTRFDLKIDFTAGIAIDLYLDGSGTPTISASVGDAGARTKPTTFVVTNKDSDHIYVSELYVADFDTRNTRPVKQVPDASGNYSAWAGGFSVLGDDDLMTAADGAVAGDKVSVNLEPYPGPPSPAGISRVVVKVIGSRGATGPQDIAPFVRIAGIDYSAGNLGVTEAPLAHYAEWAINPDTAAAWTTADLDTTEIGLEVIA